MTTTINNQKINIEVFRFENNQVAKHKKVGFVSITINEFVKIKSINLMLNTETNEYWLSLPQEKAKGKWQPLVIISKEDKQAIVNAIVSESEGDTENTSQNAQNDTTNELWDEMEF